MFQKFSRHADFGTAIRQTHSRRLRGRRVAERRLTFEHLEYRRMLSVDPVLLKDVNRLGVSGGHGPEGAVAVGDVLYFTAVAKGTGRELWKSDGTEAGTVLVKDIRPGLNSSGPGDLTVMDGTLYFSAYDGVNGRELWKSDGTDAGTVLVKDTWPGSANGSPNNLAVLGKTLYFTAVTADEGRELWKSDGTAAGTVLVKDIDPEDYSSPRYLTAAGDTLYFTADDGVHGRELWTSDGTADGTVMIQDIRPGPESSNPDCLIVVGHTLYFRADDGVHGLALWKSDGTADGTVLVKDVRLWSGTTAPFYFVAMSDTLYFSAIDGVNGYELWRSDGTPDGTVMVKDVVPGGLYPAYLTVIGDTLYFTASDRVHGRELWTSDGTEAGTVMVMDIWLGSESSRPEHLTAVGNALYFSADDGYLGREPWVLHVPPPPKPYSISGLVFVDFNHDGEVNFGEQGIAGVAITLTGTDDRGQAVQETIWTQEDGFYQFANLRPGQYYVTQTQPDDYLQGINSVGTLGGVSWGEFTEEVDQFFLDLGAAVTDPAGDTDAFNYNFGERPAAEGSIQPGQTAGIGFWQNKHGQALIGALNGAAASTQLGDWLAATLPNMFAHLGGTSNTEVGTHFRTLFAIRGQKLEAQVMATALAVYVTNQSLAGTVGQAYGFNVSTYGVGTRTYNIGSCGAAFGVEDDTEMTVLDLLLATDAMTLDGVLYYSDNTTLARALRSMANEVYSDINQ